MKGSTRFSGDGRTLSRRNLEKFRTILMTGCPFLHFAETWGLMSCVWDAYTAPMKIVKYFALAAIAAATLAASSCCGEKAPPPPPPPAPTGK
jgi:hypothetical protein